MSKTTPCVSLQLGGLVCGNGHLPSFLVVGLHIRERPKHERETCIFLAIYMHLV